MATTIICKNGFKAVGELESFDEGGEIITFNFRGVSIEVKNPIRSLVIFMVQIGLLKLKNAEINFITNRITFKDEKK